MIRSIAATAAALVTIAGTASAQQEPEYWRINVHGTLSVRAEPSTYSPAFAQLSRGMVVRNLGCAEDMGRMWCQVPIAPNDGASIGWVAMDFLLPADGPGATVDHSTQSEPTTKSKRIKFSSGATADLEIGQLLPGNSIRYLLGAADGQTLEVSFDQADPGLEYRIIMPNGHVLLDPVATTLPYQGQLYMSGDHVVEIINRGHGTASYSAYVQVYWDTARISLGRNSRHCHCDFQTMSIPGALFLASVLGTMGKLVVHIVFRDGRGAMPKALAGSAGSVLAGHALPTMGGPFSQSFLAGTVTSVLGGMSGVLPRRMNWR